MQDKKLEARIYDSLLALQCPAMAAACVQNDVNAETFSVVHKYVTGELPAPASEEESDDEDQGDMVKLLQAMPE